MVPDSLIYSMEIIKRLTGAPCVKNETFGYNERKDIWVDSGCQGDFQVCFIRGKKGDLIVFYKYASKVLHFVLYKTAIKTKTPIYFYTSNTVSHVTVCFQWLSFSMKYRNYLFPKYNYVEGSMGKDLCHLKINKFLRATCSHWLTKRRFLSQRGGNPQMFEIPFDMTYQKLSCQC